MDHSNNSFILESSLNMSTNSRINKNLLKCLVELTGNLLKVHNATDCKTEDAAVTIKHENDSSLNIDIIEHNLKTVNDERDNLSNNITILKQHTLELERIYQDGIPSHSIILNENTDDFQSFMAGPFKTLMLQNLTESSVNLTEQICNLIHMYKTEENPENTKHIRKCLSKIKKNIKCIPNIDLESSNDSQTQVSNSELNDYLSEKLGVLIKKVAKLKKVYKKKMRNDATGVVDSLINNKKEKNLNNYIQENVMEELSQIINKINTDDSNIDTDDTGVRSPKKKKYKLSVYENDEMCARGDEFVDGNGTMTVNTYPAIEREIFKKQLKSNKMKQKLLKNNSKETPAQSDATNATRRPEKSQAILLNLERKYNFNDISNNFLTRPDDEAMRILNEENVEEKFSHIVSKIHTDEAKSPENHKNVKTKRKRRMENDECGIKVTFVDDNNSMTVNVDPAIEQEIFKKQLKSNKMKQKLLKENSKETPAENDAILRPELEPILPKIEQEDNSNDSVFIHFLARLDDKTIRGPKQENVEEELSETANQSNLDIDDTGVKSPKRHNNDFENVNKKRKRSRIENDEMFAKKTKFVDENNSMALNVDPTIEQEIVLKQLKSKKRKQKLLKEKSKEISAKTGATCKPKKDKIVQHEQNSENKPDFYDDIINHYLPTSDDGAKRFQNTNEHYEILENIINDENLDEQDKLLYFKDLLYFAEREAEISPAVKKKLADLCVVIDWEVPQAHVLQRFLSRGPNAAQSKILKDLGVKYHGFTEEEDRIIRRNWRKFCIAHDLDNDPRPFLLLTHQKRIIINYKERRKFVQYLGKDLPHRALMSIYRRFRILFTVCKKGRFTPTEDKIILSIAKTNIRNRFSQLGLLLKRTRRSIQERFMVISEEFFQTAKLSWTLSLKEAMIKIIMKLTHTETIDELRQTTVSIATLVETAIELKLPRKHVRVQWFTTMYPQIYVTKRIRINPLRKKFIKCMIRLGCKNWKEKMWVKVAAEFPGFSQQFIFAHMHNFIHIFAPSHLHKNLEASLEYLNEVWIPQVKVTANYKKRCLKRLRLNENGNLEEYV